MPPRPPSSPLFPYTTLFRSLAVLAAIHTPFALAQNAPERARPNPAPAAAPAVAPPRGAAVQNATSRDRKSTRLNSSHRCISYAVFCLKKKKKKPLTHHAGVR